MRILLAFVMLLQGGAAFAGPALDQLEVLAGGKKFDKVYDGVVPNPALRATFPGSAGKGLISRRIEDTKEYSLAEKARIFQERTDRENRPWHGLILSRRYEEDPKVQRYDNFGDSLIWTGNYIASQAFRYAVTHEEEALKNMEQSLWGVHANHEATGVPGLVARVVVPKDRAEEQGYKLEWKRHEGAGKWKDHIWEGNVSFDQYTGYIFGIANAWPHIRDPKLKEAIREDMRQVGLHLIRNNMRIIGPDTFLDMRANYYYQDRLPFALRSLPLPDWRAGNSVHGLHIMKVAAEVSGDPRLKKYYEEEMILKEELDLKVKDCPEITDVIKKSEGLITAVMRAYTGEDVVAKAEYMRSDIGLNLQHMSLYDLNRLEKDPGLRDTYQGAFRKQHKIAKGEANSYWNYLYASQIAGEDKEAADGKETLRLFPMRKVVGHVKNSDDPSFPVRKGLRGDELLPYRLFTDKPLPYDRRAIPAAFAWQNNPYQLDGNEGLDDQGSGTAYLVAYWLGRYHGYLSPHD